MSDDKSRLRDLGPLTQDVYSRNNTGSGPSVNGWTPVVVPKFRADNSNFAAQLYTDGKGGYAIAFRGTDSVADATGLDSRLAAGAWHGQITDAVRFTAEAIKQVALDYKQTTGQNYSLDQARQHMQATGHSAGGSLAEVSSAFFGLKGLNVDGPGTAPQTQSAQFASLKQEVRANGLDDLSDSYSLAAGDFQARQYTVIGTPTVHVPGVEVHVDPALASYLQSVTDTPLLVRALDMGGIAVAQTAQGLATVGSHGIGGILAREGVASTSAIAPSNATVSANHFYVLDADGKLTKVAFDTTSPQATALLGGQVQQGSILQAAARPTNDPVGDGLSAVLDGMSESAERAPTRFPTDAAALSALGKAAGALDLGANVYTVGDALLNGYHREAAVEAGGALGGAAGAASGAAVGFELGATFPFLGPLTPVLGALGGAALVGWGGKEIGKATTLNVTAAPPLPPGANLDEANVVTADGQRYALVMRIDGATGKGEFVWYSLDSRQVAGQYLAVVTPSRIDEVRDAFLDGTGYKVAVEQAVADAVGSNLSAGLSPNGIPLGHALTERNGIYWQAVRTEDGGTREIGLTGSYDSNGKFQANGAPLSYSFDAQGRLTESSYQGASSAQDGRYAPQLLQNREHLGQAATPTGPLYGEQTFDARDWALRNAPAAPPPPTLADRMSAHVAAGLAPDGGPLGLRTQGDTTISWGRTEGGLWLENRTAGNPAQGTLTVTTTTWDAAAGNWVHVQTLAQKDKAAGATLQETYAANNSGYVAPPTPAPTPAPTPWTRDADIAASDLGAYRVVRGENLWAIGQREGVSVAEIQRVNSQIDDPSQVNEGQIIRLPANARSVIEAQAAQAAQSTPPPPLRLDDNGLPLPEIKPGAPVDPAAQQALQDAFHKAFEQTPPVQIPTDAILLAQAGGGTASDAGSSAASSAAYSDPDTAARYGFTDAQIADGKAGLSALARAADAQDRAAGARQAQVQSAGLDAIQAGLDIVLARQQNNDALLAGGAIRLAQSLGTLLKPGFAGSELGAALGAAGGALSLVGALQGLSSDDALTQLRSVATAATSVDGIYGAFNSGASLFGNVSGTGTDLFGNTVANVGIGAGLGSLAGALALKSAIDSGNPFAIAGSVVSTVNFIGWAANGFAAAYAPLIAVPGLGWALAVGAVMFSLMSKPDDPPPPPPQGEGRFVLDADGSIGIAIQGRNGGAEILQARMSELLKEMTEQAAEAGLTLIPERLPGVALASWPSYEGNGQTNYYFVVQGRDPGTGEAIGQAVARDDLNDKGAQIAIYLQAAVPQWEAEQIEAKRQAGAAHAADTEGQWAARQAQAALAEEVQTQGRQGEANEVGKDGKDTLTPGPSPAAAGEGSVAAAAAAAAALAGGDPLAAMKAVVGLTALGKDALTPNPTAAAAGEGSKDHQHLTALVVDLDGKGIEALALPATVGKSLEAILQQAVARFDVDDDGYREASTWLKGADAFLAIDKDGDGAISAATELFASAQVREDQRGAQLLTYYDSNQDGVLDAADPAFKAMKLWLDVDADGASQLYEVFGMQALGIERIELGGSSDSQDIRIHWSDGTDRAVQERRFAAEQDGVTLSLDDAGNSVVRAENGVDGQGTDAMLTYVTRADDLSLLTQLADPNAPLTDKERGELQALARKYGLDPTDTALMAALVSGGGNVAGSPTEIVVKTEDVVSEARTPPADEQRQARVEAWLAQREGDATLTAEQIAQRLSTELGVSVQVARAAVSLGLSQDSQAQQAALALRDANAPATIATVVSSAVGSAVSAAAPATPVQLAAADIVTWAQALAALAPLEPVTAGGPGVQPSVQIGAGDITVEDDETETPAERARREVQRLLDKAAADPAALFGVGAGVGLAALIALGLGVAPSDAVAAVSSGVAQDSLARAAQAAQTAAPVVVDVLASNPLATPVAITAPVVPVQLRLEDIVTRIDPPAAGAAAAGAGTGTGTASGGGGGAAAGLLSEPQRRVSADQVQIEPAATAATSSATPSPATPPTKTQEPVNLGPVPGADEFTATEDTVLSFSVEALLANDIEADLVFTDNSLTLLSVGNASHGTVERLADGSLRFVPQADFHGTAGFSYTVADGAGNPAVGRVTIELAARNDVPVVRGELLSNVAEDSVLAFAPGVLLANDSDNDVATDGQVLRIESVSAASHGSVVLAADGTVTFTPEANYHGEAGFSYVVSDGAGGVRSAQVVLDYAAVNDAPVAGADQASGTEDTAIVLSAAQLLANDRDNDVATDGQVLAVSAVGNAVHGSVVLDATGNAVFTPEADYHGAASYEYTLSDGAGGVVAGTVALTLAAVNDLPVAVGERYALDEDAVWSRSAAQLLANDGDNDVATDGQVLRIESVSGASHGSVALAADGTVSFTPEANYHGVAGFSYVVSDGAGGVRSAQVVLDYAAVNDAPVAGADQASGTEDTAIVLSAAQLLANDRDNDVATDGQVLAVSAVGNAVHGSVVLDATGNAVFTPEADYHGAASYEYTLSDGAGGVVAGTVALTLAAVNDLPVAVGERYALDEDAVWSRSAAQLLANDGDNDVATDGQVLRIESVSGASHGSVALAADGTVSFTPEANYHGVAGFSYVVSDGAGGVRSVRVVLDYAAVNDAPVAAADSFSIEEDSGLIVAPSALLGNDADVDMATGDSLTVARVFNALNGSVQLRSDGRVEFLPDANFNGVAGFQYEVVDSAGATATAAAIVTVTAVDDPPGTGELKAVIAEDTAIVLTTGRLLGAVSDPDAAYGDVLTVVGVTSGADTHGVATLRSDGSIEFAPAADFHGTAVFSYDVADSQGNVVAATASITVAAVNDLPLVTNDSAVGAEDTPIQLTAAGLLANDSDNDVATDGQVLTVTAVSGATHGSVTLDGAGKIVFTPDANYHGAAEFAYTVSDGAGGTGSGKVALTIAAVNDLPVAVGEHYDIDEDSVWSRSAAQLLANDSDVDTVTDGQVLSIASVGAAVHGTVQMLAGGTVSFTPDANYHGPAGFTYTVSDGAGGSAQAQVSFTVAAVNDVPIVANDSAVGVEDTAIQLTAAGLLANDSDNDVATDGQVLAVTAVSGATHGSVTLDGAGKIVFTPDADYHGVAEFAYTVADGAGGTGSGKVALTIAAVNDLPVAGGEHYDIDEDTVWSRSAAQLLANDSDVDVATDGQVLSIQSVSGASHGTVTLAGGTVSFTPDANYHGPAGFTYTVSDGAGGSAQAQVSFMVAAVNDLPVVANDSAVGVEDTAIQLTAAGLLANDSDNDVATDGQVLTVTAVSGATHGSVTLDGAGQIVFTPDADYHGAAEFTYTVADGAGGTGSGKVALTIAAVNDLPVAVGDAATISEDLVIEFAAADLLANDGDIDIATDGQVLSITAVGGASHGTVELLAGGGLRFTPDANTNGAAGFTYTVSDGAGGSATAAVAVTVLAVNDAPVAGADTASAVEDTALTLSITGLLANDSDVDIATNGQSIAFDGLLGATHGSAVLGAGGTIIYTPDADFFGAASIAYRIRDSLGATAVGQIAVQVAPVNDAPVVPDRSASGSEDQVLSFDRAALVSGAVDAENDILSVASVDGTSGGTATRNGDGSVTFVPTANYFGNAWFSYTVSDGQGGTDSAVMSIALAEVNDAPVAVGDQINGQQEDTPFNFAAATLVANDGDVDGDALTVTAVHSAQNGTVSLANGNITFAPNANFNGEAAFSYTVADGRGGTAEGQVRVPIAAINDVPVALGETLSNGTEDTALRVNLSALLANDSDVDGTSPWLYDFTGASDGSVAVDWGAQQVVFTPNANFNGNASFSYRVTDGTAVSGPTTASFYISPVNDAPVAYNKSVGTFNEDTVIPIDFGALLSGATDAENDPLTIETVGSSVHGTATIVGQTVFFNPESNYTGPTSFQFLVSDGHGDGKVWATATIDYAPVNDAPVVSDRSASGNEDQALSFDRAALVSGAVDADNDILSVASVDGTSGGTATRNGDGSVTFVPTANYFGNAWFSYTVSDGQGGTDSAVMSIALAEVNDAPVAVGDQINGQQEDTPFNFAAATLVANDGDVDGDALTVTAVHSAQNGTVSLANGTITFAPNANFNGEAAFSYTVADGRGGTAEGQVRVPIAAVNDVPVALGETLSNGVEDTALRVNLSALLANDSDVDGTSPWLYDITGAGNGSATVDWGAQQVVFTPNANFNGNASFSYRVTDGTTVSAVATAAFYVNPVNDAPTVYNEQLTAADEDTVRSISFASLLANDSDVDGNALTVAQIANFSGGNASIVGNAVVFNPTANYYGSAGFDYLVSDGNGGQVWGRAGFDYRAVNDAPVAAGEWLGNGSEDAAFRVGLSTLLGNDYDPDGNSPGFYDLTGWSNGSAYIDWGAQQVVFTPNGNFNGNASFSYRVWDGGAVSNVATASFYINAVNDNPVAGADGISVLEDGGATLSGNSQRYTDSNSNLIYASTLLANDSDVDTSTLSISRVHSASAGTSVWLDNGNVRLVTPRNFNGDGVSFQYDVSDGSGGVATTTVYVRVNPVNDAPVVEIVDAQSSPYGIYSEFSGTAAILLSQIGLPGGRDNVLSAVQLRVRDIDGDLVSSSTFQRFTGDAGQGQTLAPAKFDWASGIWVMGGYGGNNPWPIESKLTLSDGKGGATVIDVFPWGLGGQDNNRGGYSWEYFRVDGVNVWMPVGDWYPGTGEFATVPWTSLPVGNSSGSKSVRWQFDDHLEPPTPDPPYDPGGGGNPVIVDLSGDGWQFSSIASSKVRFDMNGDGAPDRIAWTGSEDGVLIFDANGNQLVDGRPEFVFTDYLPGARTDLEGLAAFDTNANGALDSGDALWSRFGVWRDKNDDGVSQGEEFLALADIDVAAFSLRSDGQRQVLAGGDVVVHGIGSFTRTDGSTGALADASFRYVTSDAEPQNVVTAAQASGGDAAAVAAYTEAEDAELEVRDSNSAAASDASQVDGEAVTSVADSTAMDAATAAVVETQEGVMDFSGDSKACPVMDFAEEILAVPSDADIAHLAQLFMADCAAALPLGSSDLTLPCDLPLMDAMLAENAVVERARDVQSPFA
jgi:LysM repeat protein